MFAARITTKIVLLTILCLLLGAFVIPAQAQPTPTINYQGKLTDSVGVAVPDGTYNMRFWLLQSTSQATTSAVWTESLTGGDKVQVTNGLFSVMLGSTSALTAVDFNQTLYLGVEIGGSTTPAWDGEMSPRKILGTVPAAFEAAKLSGIASSSFLRSDQSDTIAATTASTLLTITQSGAGDILNLFDGGTEVLTVTDGGKVGIGTTTPTASLHVDGSGGGSYVGGFPSLQVLSTTDFNTWNLVYGNKQLAESEWIANYMGNNGNLYFGNTANYAIFTIRSETSGTNAVGINIRDGNTTEPKRDLEVQADANAGDTFGIINISGAWNDLADAYSDQVAEITFGARDDSGTGAGTDLRTARIQSYNNAGGTGGDLAFLIGASGNSEALRIAETGNVGIGTTSPYAKLSVAGQVVASHFTATSTTATSTFAGDVRVNGMYWLDDYKVISGDPLSNVINVGTGNTVTAPAVAVSLGVLNTLSQSLSFAMGYNNTVSNSGGMAIGRSHTISANNAIAIGSSITNSTVNSLMIGLSDTAKLTILSTGNLGVGETAPGSKLSVSGNATIGTGYDTTAAPANGLLVEGNVGIGTTTPTSLLTVGSSTPTALLAADYYNSAYISGMLEVGGTGTSTFGGPVKATCFTTNGVDCISGTGGSGTVNVGTAGQVAYFETGGSAVSGTSTLFIASDGKVGIGTTTPQEKLHLYGGSFLQEMDSGTMQTVNTLTGLTATIDRPVIAYPYMYVSAGGLKVIDISDPLYPKILGTLTFGGGTTELAVAGHYVYKVETTGNTFRVIDVKDPSAPAVVSTLTLSDPINVRVQGQYAYVADNGTDELLIFDVSDPTRPVEIGAVSIGTNPENLYVSGGYAYVADRATFDLRVIDISDPSAPMTVGTLGIGASAKGVVVSGRYAYIVDRNSDDLKVVDVSDPTTPVTVGSVSIGADPYDLDVVGKYAYVVDITANDLKVIDVSSSTNPVIVDTFAVSPDPTDVVVSGRYAYVKDNGTGNLYTVDISGIEVTSALVHSLESGNLQVRNDASIGGLLSVRGGITAGQAIYGNAGGAFSLATSSTITQSALSGIVADGNTAGVANVLTLNHSAYSGSAGDGIGTGLLFKAEDSTGAATSTAQIASIFTDVTAATPASVLTFSTKNISGSLTEWMRLSAAGYLGLGTTSPTVALSVYGDAFLEGTDRYFNFGTTTGTNGYGIRDNAGTLQYKNIGGSWTAIGSGGGGAFTSSGGYTYLTTATDYAGIGTTTPLARLTIGSSTPASLLATDYYNSAYISGLLEVGGTGTSTFLGGISIANGAFQVAADGGITSISSLEIGNLSFEGDAGMVSWTNLDVSTAVAADTVESYTAELDGNPMLTIYGLADGSGGVYNTAIGLGTTTPQSFLSVVGTTTIGNGATTLQAGLQVGYGGICVDNDGSCVASTTGRISSVSSYTGNSDLAETYFSDTPLEPGDVVSLVNELTVDRAQGTSTIIGVVSTKPGILLGFDDKSLTEGEKSYPIALAGRIPVKLSTENGPITRGDQLMLSSLPGIAMKATGTGATIGIALEDFDGQRMYSKTYINQVLDDIGGTTTPDEIEDAIEDMERTDGDTATLADGTEVKVGKVVMYIDLGYRWLDDNMMASLGVLMGTSSITNVGENENETVFDRLVTLANSFVDGILSVFELKVNRVKVVEELCIEDVCVTADDLRTILGTQAAAVSSAGSGSTGGASGQTDNTPPPPPPPPIPDPDPTASTTDPIEEETGSTTPPSEESPVETVTSPEAEPPVEEPTIEEVVVEEPASEPGVTEPVVVEPTAPTELEPAA